MRTRLRVTPPSLPLALALRSFSNRVGKTKREKKTRGRHCSFRSETRINLSGESAAAGPQIMEIPRNGNVLRSRTGVRRNDGPLQSSYSLGLAPALVVGIVCSRRCLHRAVAVIARASPSLARSFARVTFSCRFPGSLQAPFFSQTIVWSALFTDTCPRTMSDIRAHIAHMWVRYDNTFSV